MGIKNSTWDQSCILRAKIRLQCVIYYQNVRSVEDYTSLSIAGNQRSQSELDVNINNINIIQHQLPHIANSIKNNT
ncbi:hypothetical protein CAJAP_08836 [Camponotus japonicus]